MTKRKDDIPVFDRGRADALREARELRKALEYVDSFRPSNYYDGEAGPEIPDGFHEIDLEDYEEDAQDG